MFASGRKQPLISAVFEQIERPLSRKAGVQVSPKYAGSFESELRVASGLFTPGTGRWVIIGLKDR